MMKLMARTCLTWLLAVAAIGLGGCPSGAQTPCPQPQPRGDTTDPHSDVKPVPRWRLGDDRNSVVAIPMDAPRPLTYLAGELSPDQVAQLRALAPNVRIITGLTADTALGHAGEAHGMDAHLMSSAFLHKAGELRWAQSWSAGVEPYLAIPELMSRDEVVLTNMKGMHGPVIAEHVFAMLLSTMRNLGYYRDAMKQGRWDREGGVAAMAALHDKTMLVVGLGGIGSEIAILADGFDMRVLATVRTKRPAPPYVSWLGTAKDLDQLLPEADIVVISVPLTPTTRGMFNRARFARMKRGAYLVNIARGQVVDTAALVEALDSGKLAGACLDVVDPEPLPPDHTLWRRPNVLITPHVSGRAELTQERRWSLFKENMRRFGSGKPLLNVVDKAAGY